MKLLATCSIIAAVASGTAWAQDPSVKVTYSTVAVPASRALYEISKLAGVTLKAPPQTAGEILVINVKDVPLPVLMKQIAAVTSASWLEKSGVQWLVPDNATRQVQERQEQAAYAEKLTKALQKYMADLQKSPVLDAKSADKMVVGDNGDARATSNPFGGDGPSNPTQRAIVRLIQGIGVNALTAIPKDARVVYSSNPTRMQRAFGQGSTAALNALVQEQNLYAAASKRAKASEPKETDERALAMKKMMAMFGQTDEDQPIDAAPSKAILIISRQPLFGGLNLELKIFDTNGKRLAGGTLPVMADMAGLMAAATRQAGKPEAAPKDDPAIEFSKETQNIQGFFTRMGNPGAAAKVMSPETSERLSRPDLYDPLSYVESEALIASAKFKGEQLVADLPDAMVSFLNMLGSGTKTTVHSFLTSLRDNQETKLDEKDGWMTVAPGKPVTSRQHRLDRPALATLIQAVKGKELPALDDIAAYSLKNESPVDQQISMMYLMLYAPSAMQQGFGGMVNWDMLRLYATLGQPQRQSLFQGGKIEFGTLTAQQRDLVGRLLFGPETDLAVLSEKPKKEVLEMPSIVRRMFGGGKGDYRTEPTEIMPDGLPSQGFIQVGVTSSTVAKMADAKGGLGMFSGAALSSDELGMLKFFREDPNMSQFAGFMPSIDNLRLGSRTTYDFKFYAAPDVAMSQVLNDDSMAKDAAVVKYDSLPANFQKEISDKAAEFKKLPFFDPSILGGGKRSIPPL